MDLPYWGIDTFKDLNSMDDREVESLTVSEFMALYGSSDTSMLSVFKTLVHSGCLLYMSSTEYAWCSDIRFNYRDRVIYVSYLAYEVEEFETDKTSDSPYIYWVSDGVVNVRYGFTRKNLILFNVEDWNIDEAGLLTVFDTKTKRLVEIDLSECDSVFPELDNEYLLLDNLVDVYSSFYKVKSSRPSEKYMRLESKNRKSFDKVLRVNNRLPLWDAKMRDLVYSDLRLANDRETIAYEDYLDLRTELESGVMWLMGVSNRVRNSVIEHGQLGFGGDVKLYLKWYYAQRCLTTRRVKTTDRFFTAEEIELLYN